MDPGIVEEIEFDFHGVIVVRVGWITSLVNRLKFKQRKQKVQWCQYLLDFGPTLPKCTLNRDSPEPICVDPDVPFPEAMCYP